MLPIMNEYLICWLITAAIGSTMFTLCPLCWLPSGDGNLENVLINYQLWITIGIFWNNGFFFRFEPMASILREHAFPFSWGMFFSFSSWFFTKCPRLDLQELIKLSDSLRFTQPPKIKASLYYETTKRIRLNKTLKQNYPLLHLVYVIILGQ